MAVKKINIIFKIHNPHNRLVISSVSISPKLLLIFIMSMRPMEFKTLIIFVEFCFAFLQKNKIPFNVFSSGTFGRCEIKNTKINGCDLR